jgi:hypothetical protein
MVVMWGSPLLVGRRNLSVNWLLYFEEAHIVGLLESAKCRKCRREEETSYHIL